MEQDNRMITSDVDHADDDIEIDIDAPQQDGQGSYNQDVMIDDISITSQPLEDADMMDGDEQYMEDDINDEPMDYYEEDGDAAIEDAPEEHNEYPEEEMTIAEDMVEEPMQHENVQEVVPQSQPQSTPSTQQAAEVAQPASSQPAAVEPSVSATVNEISLEQAPETPVAPDLAEKSVENMSEEQVTSAVDAQQPHDAQEEVPAPTENPSHGEASVPVQDDAHQEGAQEEPETGVTAEQHTAENETEGIQEKTEHTDVANDNKQPESHHSPQAEEEQPVEGDPKNEATETQGHQEENPIVDASLALHSVKVIYQDNEIYLFPPPESDATDTFFLHDESLAGQPICNLLEACRGVLGDHITEDEELYFDIDRLGLSFIEHPSKPYTMSLYQVVELYLRLCANDEDNHPEPMYITLHTKLNTNAEFANLVEAARSGKGLSYFEAYEEDTGDQESDEAAVEQEEESYIEQGEESAEIYEAEEHEESHDAQGHDIGDQETAQEENTAQNADPTTAPESDQQQPAQDANQDDLEHATHENTADVNDKPSAESEFGSTTETYEHEASEELYSDLGNQTIAEYEGYNSQYNEMLDTHHDKPNEDDISAAAEEPVEQTAVDDDSNAAGHDEHASLESVQREPDVTDAQLEPVAQGQEPVPPAIHTEGLDTRSVDADANADNYEDAPHAYEAEEYDENGDDNDELTEAQRIEARESDEEAQIGEFDDEYKEADSDNELEEPLEGIDDVDQAYPMNDEETTATDDRVFGEAALHGDADEELESGDGVPAIDDGEAESEHQFDEYLGGDTAAPAHYEDFVDAVAQGTSGEGTHAFTEEYAGGEGEAEAEADEVDDDEFAQNELDGDDAASVKRSRDEDEADESEAKRRRS